MKRTIINHTANTVNVIDINGKIIASHPTSGFIAMIDDVCKKFDDVCKEFDESPQETPIFEVEPSEVILVDRAGNTTELPVVVGTRYICSTFVRQKAGRRDLVSILPVDYRYKAVIPAGMTCCMGLAQEKHQFLRAEIEVMSEVLTDFYKNRQDVPTKPAHQKKEHPVIWSLLTASILMLWALTAYIAIQNGRANNEFILDMESAEVAAINQIQGFLVKPPATTTLDPDLDPGATTITF